MHRGTVKDREARPTRHQHHPHAVHRCGPAGEVGSSRHADGAGAAGLHAVEPDPELRPEGSDLARPRPLRAVQRPRLDAAVVDALPDANPGGERRLRERWASRRSRSTTSATSGRSTARRRAIRNITGSRGVETTTGPAGAGHRHQRRHGDRAQVAGQPLQQAGLRSVRLQRLRHLRRRLPDGGRGLGGGVARRPPPARRPVLDLRQQPHHDRRQDQHHLHRGCRGALPRLSLERAARRRRQRPRPHRGCVGGVPPRPRTGRR